MKHYMTALLISPTRFLLGSINSITLITCSLIIPFSCILAFILIGKTTHQDEMASVASTTSALSPEIPISTPSKWWIKVTATPSATSWQGAKPSETEVASSGNCGVGPSTTLKPGTYAYISMTPLEPNRIRSGAGKKYAYLGQIEPGSGVQILDGPICADGFSWWLVESTQNQLRGWTAAGRAAEQWVIPCPDQMMTCHMKPRSTPTLTVSQDSDKYSEPGCRSERFSVGVVAQVKQDSLLVIRLEPGTDTVTGRVGPLSAVNILGGPICVSASVWWNVEVTSNNVSGWATEDNLMPCSREVICK